MARVRVSRMVMAVLLAVIGMSILAPTVMARGLPGTIVVPPPPTNPQPPPGIST